MLSPQCAGGEAAIVIGFAVEEEAADSAVAKTTAQREKSQALDTGSKSDR